MQRKEQIQDAAADHRDWVCCGFIDPVTDARQESFVEGAEWADDTMLEKVCKWLDSINPDDYMDSGIFQIHTLSSNLRKAMEE